MKSRRKPAMFFPATGMCLILQLQSLLSAYNLFFKRLLELPENWTKERDPCRHTLQKMSLAGETTVLTPQCLKLWNDGSTLLFHGHIFQGLIIPNIKSFHSAFTWTTLCHCSTRQLQDAWTYMNLLQQALLVAAFFAWERSEAANLRQILSILQHQSV